MKTARKSSRPDSIALTINDLTLNEIAHVTQAITEAPRQNPIVLTIAAPHGDVEAAIEFFGFLFCESILKRPITGQLPQGKIVGGLSALILQGCKTRIAPENAQCIIDPNLENSIRYWYLMSLRTTQLAGKLRGMTGYLLHSENLLAAELIDHIPKGRK